MKNMPLHHKTRDDGFTIVELAVIVPILVVAVIVLFQSLFFLVRTSNIDRTKISSTYEIQNALGIMESDVLLTDSFLPTTDTSVTDPYKPASNFGQWSYQGDSLTSANRVLIMRNFSTTKNSLSANRKPAFLSTLGCDPSTIYTNDVLYYNLIYFVSNGILYRRHAVDTSKATCETPYQQQSCPSLETLGLSSRDSVCQADDEIVARDVSAFSVQYYPTANSTTPIDTYNALSDPESVTAASAVEVTLTVTRMSYGQSISNSSSIRIAKVNAMRNE